MTNSEWVTVREACEISKKPEVTIRRLVKRLVSDKSKTSQNLKIDKSRSVSKYLLRKDYIKSLYTIKEKTRTDKSKTSHDKSNDLSVTSQNLIDILKTELTEKNKQIEKLQDTLKNQQVLNLEMTKYLEKSTLPAPGANQTTSVNRNDSSNSKTKKWWWF